MYRIGVSCSALPPRGLPDDSDLTHVKVLSGDPLLELVILRSVFCFIVL